MRECIIPGCGRVEKKIIRGWCSKHYSRWRSTGDPLGSNRLTYEERFWSKVQKTETCWLWTDTLVWGYGKFRYGDQQVQAHRFAYKLLVGPIPLGMVLDHVRARGCTHKNCVNPVHLEIVTNKENLLRGPGMAYVNSNKTHCDYGHPFDEVNTYRYPNGIRECRECRRRRDRIRKKRDYYARSV